MLSTAGPWSFNYTPGVTAYQVARSAAVESQTESGSHREIATNASHELLTLETAGDTIRFTAGIDTLSTTTQGLIGSVQPIQLPIQISGSLIGDSLLLSSDSLPNGCNPVTSMLATDLRNLIVHFPAQLRGGSNWRDSLEVKGCHGMIPTTSHLIRSYTVSGQTEYQGHPVLLIQRLDTIQTRGDGAQEQHHITLEASGTGTAAYYVSLTGENVVRLIVEQDFTLRISAATKTSLFRQRTKQDFGLSR